MNLIDSSGWLEYFSDGPNADVFTEPIIASSEPIIIPTIIIYEIFKKVLSERREDAAIQTVAQLKKYRSIPLDENIALSAAKISYDRKIPMADSIIYASAKRYDAVVWTQDEDFKDLPNVKYILKN